MVKTIGIVPVIASVIIVMIITGIDSGPSLSSNKLFLICQTIIVFDTFKNKAVHMLQHESNFYRQNDARNLKSVGWNSWTDYR